jgi:N-acetyl-gamma-glutamyl-phosphate reductase
MKKAKIVGAGGYGGVGITELLLSHPEVEIVALVAATETGMKMSELYPHLAGFCDLPILTPDDPAAQVDADVVFFSTPDGVGMVQAKSELAKGAKVIDYSGDFRFQTVEEYAEYARRLGKPTEHKAPDLLTQSMYGVPELRRSQINPSVKLIGNPGCFAVGVEIGLAPAIAHKLVQFDSIICDCKSAVSGAGKKPKRDFPLSGAVRQHERLPAHRPPARGGGGAGTAADRRAADQHHCSPPRWCRPAGASCRACTAPCNRA